MDQASLPLPPTTPFAPPPSGFPPLSATPSSPLAGFNPGDLSHAEVFRRYSIAWFSIALFDTLATCPGEYEYILTAMWNAKFTPVQGLFLTNRWGSLAMQALLLYIKFGDFSPRSCSHAFFLNAFASIFISFFCSCIVSVRVWALYDRGRAISILLVLMLISQLCLQIGPAAQLHPVVPPPELKAVLHLPGCGAATRGRLSGGTDTLFWIASLAFDSAIFGLTLYRSVTVTKRAGFKLPIVRRLVRDGLFYFAIITSSNVVSVVFVTQTANLFLRPFQAPASLALLSLMCSRLVLSLFGRKHEQGSSGLKSSSHHQPKPIVALPPKSHSNHPSTTSADLRQLETSLEEPPNAVPLRTLGTLDFVEPGAPSSTGFAHLRSPASCSTLKSGSLGGIRVQRSTVVTLSD